MTAKVVTGTYTAPEAGRATVADVYEVWIKSQPHVTEKTLGMRRGAWAMRVEPVFGHLAVAEVRATAVKGWISAMVEQGLSAPVIEVAFSVLRGVMVTAIEDQRIARNPCSGVKLPKRVHADRGYLTHQQVALLASKVDYLPEVIRFLAYTGLRWGEMAALRVQDFDMLRRRVNVSRAFVSYTGKMGTPKSHERRSVPFPASLSVELAALMVSKDRDDLVFASRAGRVLRGNNHREVFSRAVTACRKVDPAFPVITPHDLRHTAASLAVSAGANVKAVQRMLGHAKASMTLDVYADLFDSDLDSVADSLDVALRAAAAYPLRTETADQTL